MNIQYFDNYLIGIPFKKGYRITINKTELSANQFLYKFVNFLANKFGEPITENNIISAKTYILCEKKNKIILILKTKEQLDLLIKFLNIEPTFDYKTLSTYNKLIDNLTPFIFEPITAKNKNKIREIARKILYLKPYEFTLNISKMGIHIKTNDDEYHIGAN